MGETQGDEREHDVFLPFPERDSIGGDVENRTTRTAGAKTYVRIINDVDAARMARFPVNFMPNVGYIWRITSGVETYRIEDVQCLM